MPSHGIEIIDGIPVTLKDGVMYAFQPGTQITLPIRLGTFSQDTKIATWEPSQNFAQWVTTHQSTLTPRQRKP